MARMSHYNLKGLRVVGPLMGIVLVVAIVLTVGADLSTGRKIAVLAVEAAVALVAAGAFAYRYRQLSRDDT